MTAPAQSFNTASASQAEKDIALLNACSKGNTISEIKDLLQQGANPNTIGENGADCLLMAVLSRNENAVIELLAHKANPNYAGFKLGKTALMWAAHMGQRENVIRMLDAGADPLLTAENGMNAADWADDNRKIAVRETIRDFIHDREQAAVAAEKAAAEKAEADAFQATLQKGIPLDHEVTPMKTIRLKRADKLRP